ncbi:MAG TPA: GNAT family N-acetyltransferase [Thermoleophilaceae bacterium]
MAAIAETERLRLREFRPDDLDDLARMFGDADQMRFYPGLRTRPEASAWINRNLALYRARGYGFWCVELTTDGGGFAGYCGIRPLDLHGTDETEIGWHIKKTFWNHGLASEAAGAVRELASTRFGLTRLVALVYPEHSASRRVAEKIGMRAAGSTVLEGDPYVIYVT